MREANSVCKDYNGFIWASAKTGILRLTDDGYRFYQLPYEKTNVITVRLVYRDSTLIAYTNNGQLFKYNEVVDRFELLINVSKFMNSNFMSVISVILGEDNSLWIASTLGLFQFHNDQIENIGINRESYNLLAWYNNHELIIAKDSSFLIYNTNEKNFTTLFQFAQSDFDVSSLLFDKTRNVIWIGTVSNGIYYYDFTNKKLHHLNVLSFPEQPVMAMEFNSDSTMFAGIDGQGIWELNLNSTKVLNVYKENINDPNSLRGNGVYDILKDENNRVWVCTYSSGVSYFDQATNSVQQITHQINNSNSLVNNDVNCIIEDKKGRLWVATNNGVSCWDRNNNRWNNFYSNKQEQAQVFLTLCEDDFGHIWAGTYSSGIYVLDSNTGKELHHYSSKVKDSPIKNDFVFDIYKDSEGDIWIGGVNEPVIRYQEKTNSFHVYNAQPLNVFAESEGDRMLMGCAYGLSVSDRNSTNFGIIYSGVLVFDILVQDSIVWLCTGGDGLIRYNPLANQRVPYTTATGLPSNFINSIVLDDGFLWLGTENGICRFNPVDKSVHTYAFLPNLSSLSFNKNAVCKLSNGQLAFGSNNGIVIFNPKTIQNTQSKAKIFIQDLSITGRSVRDIPSINLNKPVDKLKEINLNYNQNTITLELLPIGASPGSKFSWKMEGLDENWSSPSINRMVTYTNINSKDYKLRIRLYDSSLSTILDEKVLDINVTPPFWSTWYFFVIVFILITVIIYLALWYYINMLKQQHTEEKVRFFTNTAHDIRTSLTLIKAPVEELIKEKNLSDLGSHYLNLAIEQSRRLSSVVTQLMDFQKVDVGKGQLSLTMVDLVNLIKYRIQMFESVAKNKAVELSFSTNQSSYLTGIDEVMIEKVIDNLISNAVKYSTQKGKVSVNLQCGDNKWRLEVKDEGIGISRKAQRQLFKEFYRGENAVNAKIVGSGIGLLLVKNYVSLHDGEVDFISQENVGSTFYIDIPRKEVVETTKRKIENIPADSALSERYSSGEKPNGQETSVEKEMRILIVEDNDDLRNFIKTAFKEEFEVYTAEDGIIAWEIIQKQLPDLVVSDVMMPNMDGYELCQIVKSTYETSHIPIIMLTALSEKTEQLHGLGLGADDYLTKPFDLNLLQQKIKTIIKNRNAVREKALKLIKGSSNEPILANQLNDQFVKKILEVVQENISNTEFNKNTFAAAMNVSSSLLYKKIKSLTDQSPTDFIKTVRLDHALELLKGGQNSVTEVSELCGFTSVGYFSTVFKKHFGKMPTEVMEK